MKYLDELTDHDGRFMIKKIIFLIILLTFSAHSVEESYLHERQKQLRTNFKKFLMEDNPSVDKFMEENPTLKQENFLNLSNQSLNDQKLQRLAPVLQKMSELDILDLGENIITSLKPFNSVTLENLRWLRLNDNKILLSGIGFIFENYPNLKRLDLNKKVYHLPITDFDKANLYEISGDESDGENCQCTWHQNGNY